MSSVIPLNITTTFTLYSLSASTACSRSNNSILSIADLGKPTLHEIDIDGLNLALNWLLNYTAQGLPAMSSLAYMFSNAASKDNYHDWSVATYQSLKSILAFPIWVFSVNNFGDRSEEPLPPEFHTSASLSKPLDKIVLNPAAFIAYIVLQATVIMVFWAVIIWHLVCKSVTPKLSSYPLVDFAAKLVCEHVLGERRSMSTLQQELPVDAESKEVITSLQEVRVLRRIESERQGSQN